MNAPASSQIVYLHAVSASHGQEGDECARFLQEELAAVLLTLCEMWKVCVEVYKLAVMLRKTIGQISYERDF